MATNYAEAAARHWDDASLLRDRKRHGNADQLLGLVAECCLKAIMVEQGEPTNVDGDLQAQSKRIHIDVLWDEFQTFMSGRRRSRIMGRLSNFTDNPFGNWTVSQRYCDEASVPRTNVVLRHFEAARACMAAMETI